MTRAGERVLSRWPRHGLDPGRVRNIDRTSAMLSLRGMAQSLLNEHARDVAAGAGGGCRHVRSSAVKS